MNNEIKERADFIKENPGLVSHIPRPVYEELQKRKTLMDKGAVVSENGKCRYSLWRIWDDKKPKVMFIMLNPSTADATEDDPTIRRCIGFARSWGYGGIYVGNLFPYRATNPKDLLTVVENTFAKVSNNLHLREMEKLCDKVIYAWGNGHILKKMGAKYFLHFENAHYLELSKDGTPKHPLYLKGDLKPKPLSSESN